MVELTANPSARARIPNAPHALPARLSDCSVTLACRDVARAVHSATDVMADVTTSLRNVLLT